MGASGVRGPQLDELVGAYPNYNEEEEERRYYRRKRLAVVKNVLAASAGATLTYGVYLGTRAPGAPRSPGAPASGKRNRARRPASPFPFRFPVGCPRPAPAEGPMEQVPSASSQPEPRRGRSGNACPAWVPA